MQYPRFIPPLSMDCATSLWDSPTSGKTFSAGAKYLDDWHFESPIDFRGLSTTASSLSLVLPEDISPMSAPPRFSGTELSFPGKRLQNHTRRIWKLFTRKTRVDNTRPIHPPFKRITTSNKFSVKQHKSTPDLKGSWPNFIKETNVISRCAPCHGFPPTPSSASSAAAFKHTSAEPGHPTIILVIDDNWDASSADYPLQRVEQTIPVDITDEEDSESFYHPDTNSHHTPQYQPIRRQRRRTETNKSSREQWFKKRTHDPDTSFLNMDVKIRSTPFWF